MVVNEYKPKVFSRVSKHTFPVYQKNKTNVLQAQGMVRGYCAMAKDEKDAEDGRKALAYNGAVPMIAYMVLERRIFGKSESFWLQRDISL